MPADPPDRDALSFADLPRLELDQLLGQLVERAQEVMSTQGRLRGLLRANQLIVGDISLPAVLQRIAEAARELVGARYAALGVIAPEGGLAEFIHVGVPPETVEEIGHLPQGKGLLGALIEDPRPIRLRRITDDARSSGFPPGHPPMHSFIGVPIRIRDEVFGNLYLAESSNGQFSAEDEQLTTALAATAAVAIDNARLYESARMRQEWLRASATITGQLLSAEPNHPLQHIADSTRDIADADLVVVVLPDDDDPRGSTLRVDVAVGVTADRIRGLQVPLEGSLSGRVFTTGEPLLATWATDPPDLTPTAAAVPDIGPVLLVPLVGSQRIHGVLTAGRLRGRRAFTAEDLDMAAGFASQASVAIELAEARAEQQRAAMLDERDRIAADLHDLVIQRLFAAGLSLQSIAAGLTGTPRHRILGTIQDLDDTISQIRTSIFQLQQPPGPERAGVRHLLLDVVTAASPALGFEPAVRFTGLLEGTLPDEVTEDLAAVLREGLTNIARHAQARSAEVHVIVRAEQLTLEIQDDGVGMDNGVGTDATTRRSGLRNLQRRAERHGGKLTTGPAEPRGTVIRWSVPLHQPDP